MKKIISLLRACMTSDMSLFKINTKKSNGKKNKALVGFIALCFMSSVWSYANMLFEKLAPMHMQFLVLSMFVLIISVLTIIEGIYKTGSLIFDCRDDNLLLSLPLKRRTVLFVRVFKFYVFELLFSFMFVVPLVVAYLRWAEVVEWTFFLTSFVMLLLVPIIPIIISCIIGAIMTSLSSRFHYKKIAQTIISMLLLVFVLYISYSLDDLFEYVAKHANSVFDFISKIYYPAGAYAKLVMDFNIKDLIIFILVNISLFALAIYVLSLFYFKINSRIKNVTTSKKVNIGKLTIKSTSVRSALIKKEISTFINVPVFIINAGFGLLLYIIACVMVCIKYDSFVTILTDPKTFDISLKTINSNLSVIIFCLIAFTAFTTSITSSVISLEGKNINILKTLPLKVETVLMSKFYAALLITTPVIILGDLILFIRFPISIIDMFLLLILSIIVPCLSHFVGLIINLKYPKLDADNPAEVVKQSTSSFLSVMIGMILMFLTMFVVFHFIGSIPATILLLLATIIFLVLDIILFIYLKKIGTKEFSKLSV